MLTFDQLDVLSSPIIELYSKLHDSILSDIIRRISKNLRVTSSAAWQMQRMIEAGMLYEEIVQRVARANSMSQSTLMKMMREAGVQSMKFDDTLYKMAGLNPLPLNLSPAMINVLKVSLQKTGRVLENLTSTTALASQHRFIQEADLAYLQVSTGGFTYDRAMRSACRRLADEGIKVVEYQKKSDQLDVAARRAILTGVAQTSGVLQIERMLEMGVDLVQTSAHIGARPTHEVWQGRIFSLTGKDGYPNFYEVTGYGTGPGLMGWNCRHSFYPYFKGLSSDLYRNLDEYVGETVTYNGKELTFYEATQAQRKIEREIRKSKREALLLAEAGLDNQDALKKVRDQQAKMRDFINQTGLDRQRRRERIFEGAVPKVVAKVIDQQPLGLPPELKQDPQAKDAAKKRRLNELSAQTGISDPVSLEAELRRAIDYMQEEVNRRTLAVRARFEGAEKIIAEGRFKSQFETQTSGGMLDNRFRGLAEESGFGYPEKLDPMKRPIYGYFADLTDPKESLSTAQYGGVRFIVKEEVRNRTTVTWGDSLHGLSRQELYPPVSTKIDVGAFDSGYKLKSALNRGRPSYFEAQIHNQLTIDDIEKVQFLFDEKTGSLGHRVIDNDERLLVEKIKQMLTQKGIKWEHVY